MRNHGEKVKKAKTGRNGKNEMGLTEVYNRLAKKSSVIKGYVTKMHASQKKLGKRMKTVCYPTLIRIQL